MKSSIKALIIACVVLVLGGALTLVVINGLKQRPEQTVEQNVDIDDYLEFELNEDGSGYIVSLRSHMHAECPICKLCTVSDCDGKLEEKCAGHDGHEHAFNDKGKCECGVNKYAMKDRPVDVPIDLYVPATYKQLPVVEIANFQNTRGVEQLFLPTSVTKIQKGAINATNTLALIEVPYVGLTAEDDTEFKSIFSAAPTSLTVVVLGGSKISASAFKGLEYVKEVQLSSSIETIGNNAFLNAKNLSVLTIENLEESKLSEIGENAFSGCQSLTNISFPNTLSKLGVSAFKGCTKLTNMTFPSTITVLPQSLFEGCTALELVSLKSTVTEIGAFAFKGCTALTQMVLPKDFKKLGESAFEGCTSIKEIQIPSGVEVIAKNAFKGCNHLNSVILSEGLLTIEESAFNGCARLSSCEIPSTLKTIEKLAFANCDKISKFTIYSSLETIGADSFIGCDSLTTIEIVESEVFSIVEGLLMDKEGSKLILFPNGLIPADGKVVVPSFVTVINEHAFDGLVSLKELVVPETVVEVGQSAFANCANLETVSLYFIGKNAEATGEEAMIGYAFTKPAKDANGKDITDASTLESLKKLVYNGTKMEENALVSAKKLEELTIGFIGVETNKTMSALFDGVSASLKKVVLTTDVVIPAKAFSKFASLEEVIILNEFTVIEENAFQNCVNLKTIKMADDDSEGINLPASLVEIEEGAFSGCSSIEVVNFSEGVKEISENLFKGCSSLVEVNFSDTIETISTGAFSGCSSLETLKIGKNVSSIASNVFTATTQCKSLEIDTENANYVFKDHALLSKDETILYAYFASGNDSSEYTISDTVKVIGEYAFAGCTQLTKVTFGANVEKIEQSAFQMCTRLVEVIFNENLKEIGVNAFRSCSELAYSIIAENIEVVESNAFANCPNVVLYVANSKEANWDVYYSEEVGTKYEVLPFVENGFQYIVKDEKTIITRYVGDLEEVTVPNELGGYTVTELGKKAFRNVGKLTKVHFEALSVEKIDVQTFYNCGSLLEVTFAAECTVTHIEANAFEKAVLLNTVVLSPSVTHIAENAFSECGALETISVLDKGATSGLLLPEGLVHLGDNAFNQCLNLTSITLPTTLEYIGLNLFNKCASVEELSIPYVGTTLDSTTGKVSDLFGAGVDISKLKTITLTTKKAVPNNAFGYLSIETVVLPEGMTTIGNNAFSQCTSLVNVTLPSTLTSLGRGAFEMCAALEEITLPASLKTIQRGTFASCKALKVVNFPAKLTKIDESAFANCVKLEAVELGDRMEEIGDSAFSGCESLKTVKLGTTYAIFSAAFENCTSLATIIIPETVGMILDNVFEGCSSLKYIYVESLQPGSDWATDWETIDSSKKEKVKAEVIWGHSQN